MIEHDNGNSDTSCMRNFHYYVLNSPSLGLKSDLLFIISGCYEYLDPFWVFDPKIKGAGLGKGEDEEEKKSLLF